ncbi:hypothetical protein BIZ38_19685 [Pseudoalteromonas sp. BZK2]|uniref:hypothetical protein n=1 Tax=Pseudoalteromonas sp. BZK2 TaxID=1904458 RepID=UPI00165430AD|nr:hypothetical protein [Pseudoalteromonas sp. BZK2]MBC7010670.1 hypothetical protein [Pseudoalteromonas sp. BZK2]
MRLSSLVFIVFAAYFFIANVSASIMALFPGGSGSPSYVFILLIIGLAWGVKKFSIFMPIRIYVILATLLCSLLISQVIHQGSLKLILYFIFSFSVAALLTKEVVLKFYNFLRWFVLIFSIPVIVSCLLYYAGGGEQVNILKSLIVQKQEITMLFSIYLGFFVYQYGLRNVLFLDYVCLFLAFIISFLVGIKSIVFIAFGLYFLIPNRSKTERLSVITLSLCFCVYMLADNVILAPIFGTEHLFSTYDLRKLDTFYVRVFLFEENFRVLISDVSNTLFGYGYNPVEGLVYKSETTWFSQEMSNVYESGVLYIIANSGVSGFMLFSIVFYCSIKNNKSLSAFIFISLLLSNIFQDNMNSIFWLFLGFALYEKYPKN